MFNEDQLKLFNEIMDAVINNRPLCKWGDGKAGVGKTTVVQAICDKVRSLKKVVLPMATSAFAAQLYDGGRTVHSTFKVRRLSISLSC